MPLLPILFPLYLGYAIFHGYEYNLDSLLRIPYDVNGSWTQIREYSPLFNSNIFASCTHYLHTNHLLFTKRICRFTWNTASKWLLKAKLVIIWRGQGSSGCSFTHWLEVTHFRFFVARIKCSQACSQAIVCLGAGFGAFSQSNRDTTRLATGESSDLYSVPEFPGLRW